MKLVSDGYKALLQERYTRPGWGASGRSHADTIRLWCHMTGAKTILDYGCGRGTLKEAMHGFEVAEYDPGIVGKDDLPEPADMIACTDVLEHIEPEHFDDVMMHIYGLMLVGGFFVIATNRAKEVLPDGRNAHINLHGNDWWMRQFTAPQFKWRIEKAEARKGLWLWVRK